ncbi:DNA-binding protein [Massilia sp. LjRoot122]|uniref:DNA-binding protein n=1 Tax=Massilia sp. LjRoot122 TaxID=3342257 RepID=UPI003ED053CE
MYFSDVKRARDALIAKGRRPSIDAVRAEMGDTGSKTTIHKYLRELEAQEEVRSYSVSEAIQELVARLAEQLKSEAGVEIADLREQLATEREKHALDLKAAETNLAAANASIDEISATLSSTQDQLSILQSQFHEEQVARHTAEQRSRDIVERLADSERHQKSLEQKHAQAREALEHFRTAVKDQREQEGRRHEQQVQSVQAELRQANQSTALKLEQLTQLNKEAAALAAELAAGKQALYQEKESIRALRRRIEQLESVESRAAALEAQHNDVRARKQEIEAELAKANEACSELRRQNAALESELASTRLTNTLEQKIAQLQKAVFGPDQPAATTEPAGE